MTTKTYSERQQAIYFRASREMIKVAADLLDDTQEDAEFQGASEEWVRNKAKRLMDSARDLETLGFEVGPYPTGRQTYALLRAKVAYSDALTRYLNRKDAALERGRREEQ